MEAAHQAELEAAIARATEGHEAQLEKLRAAARKRLQRAAVAVEQARTEGTAEAQAELARVRAAAEAAATTYAHEVAALKEAVAASKSAAGEAAAAAAGARSECARSGRQAADAANALAKAEALVARFEAEARGDADWESVDCSVHPPPAVGLDSPLIDALLSHWENSSGGAGSGKSMMRWMAACRAAVTAQAQERDSSACVTKPFNLTGLLPEVSDGMEQLLVPLLRHRHGVKLRVLKRTTCARAHDLRLEPVSAADADPEGYGAEANRSSAIAASAQVKDRDSSDDDCVAGSDGEDTASHRPPGV